MVRVFVTGANGYIGRAVCTAARRAGHEVYGLVRSPEQGPDLVRNEVVPVIADVTDVASYRDAMAQCSVLIHTASPAPMDVHDATVVDGMLALAASRPAKATRIIYTSGCLAYPDSLSVVDETAATSGSPLIAYRLANELKILSSPHACGVVLRPSFIYGSNGANQGSFFDYFLKQHTKEKIVVGVAAGTSWSVCHVQDMADCYVRAIEAPSSAVSGQIFNVSEDTFTDLHTIAGWLARHVGCTQPLETDDGWLRGFWPLGCSSALCTSAKARRELGWAPRFNLYEALPLVRMAYDTKAAPK